MKMMDIRKIGPNGSKSYTFRNQNHYYNFRPEAIIVVHRHLYLEHFYYHMYE